VSAYVIISLLLVVLAYTATELAQVIENGAKKLNRTSYVALGEAYAAAKIIRNLGIVAYGFAVIGLVVALFK
jgi:hypothetical protein